MKTKDPAMLTFDSVKFAQSLAKLKARPGPVRPKYALGDNVLVYAAGRIRPAEAEDDYRCLLFGVSYKEDIGWDEGSYGARSVGFDTGIHYNDGPGIECSAQWSGPFPQKWCHSPISGGFGGHGVAETAAAQSRLHEFNRQRIKECDVFVFEIASDFSLAFGTHYEVGYADALGKPLIALVSPNVQPADLADYWFLTQNARIVQRVGDFSSRLLKAIEYAAGGHD